jgi:chromosome segregation ATPase
MRRRPRRRPTRRWRRRARAADDAIKQAAERERDAIEKRDAALRDVALVQNALDAAQAVADERAGEHNEYRQRAQAALQRADDDNARLVEQLRALESTRDEARSASAAHAQRDVEHGATLERLQHELESARTVAAAADDARRAAEAQRADAVGAIADAERRAHEELTHLRSRVQSGNELIEEQAKQLQQLQSQLAASEQSVAAAQRELDTVLAAQHAAPAAAPSESAAAASAMTADSTQSGGRRLDAARHRADQDAAERLGQRQAAHSRAGDCQ